MRKSTYRSKVVKANSTDVTFKIKVRCEQKGEGPVKRNKKSKKKKSARFSHSKRKMEVDEAKKEATTSSPPDTKEASEPKPPIAEEAEATSSTGGGGNAPAAESITDAESRRSSVSLEDEDEGKRNKRRKDKEDHSRKEEVRGKEEHGHAKKDEHPAKKEDHNHKKEEHVAGRGKSSSTNSASPKSTTSLDGQDGEDSLKSVDSPGPKVPPLKIVIPQAETEQGSRNGKNTARHHPYVVVSNDETATAASTVTTSPSSPAVQNAVVKEEPQSPLSASTLSNEEHRVQQRVLRSTHSNKSAASNSSSNGCTSGSNSSATSGSSSPVAPDLSPQTDVTAPKDESKPAKTEPSTSSGAGGGSGSGGTSTTTTATTTTTTSTASTTTATKSGKAADSAGKGKTEPVVKVKMESEEEPPPPPTAAAKPNTADARNTAAVCHKEETTNTVELHPRKRKLKSKQESTHSEPEHLASFASAPHPHEVPVTNCYQMFMDIRRQIDVKRKGLFPIQPKPPQGFKDYLMNRCTYTLAGNSVPRLKRRNADPPEGIPESLRELYLEQEADRYSLRMQHVVEKEKLVLSVEQEILRVHGRAARALANQALPFSVCTILKDEEVYNVITPEQEEKDRNARSRYNGRLFISWLQDVDDKWEKIKEEMLARHHKEAESLNAVQKFRWDLKMRQLGLWKKKKFVSLDDSFVPMISVSDDFDLLPE